MQKAAGMLISLGLLFASAGCGGTAPANESPSSAIETAIASRNHRVLFFRIKNLIKFL